MFTAQHSARTGQAHASVDLGKTNCRVRLEDAWGPLELRGPGFPGLAAHDGARLAFDAIDGLLARMAPARTAALAAITVGAAGSDSSPEGTLAVARLTRDRWSCDVTIASDVLTAHLGALAGRAGTTLIAGTGAVALHIADDGEATRSDGWGPWLGDAGSGRWIGQRGLVAVLEAADRRGPSTALAEDALALTGSLGALPRYISGGPDPARALAAFAPAVLERARQRDAVARAIVDSAVTHLSSTVVSIAPPGSTVAAIGGLVDDADFRRSLAAALAQRAIGLRDPAGTPLDGAALLGERRDLPHERYVTRV